MGRQVSLPLALGVIAIVLVAFGALGFWRSRPVGDGRAYSEATARLEQSGALEQAEAQEKARQAMTPEQRRAMDELVRDRAPQAEKDSR